MEIRWITFQYAFNQQNATMEERIPKRDRWRRFCRARTSTRHIGCENARVAAATAAAPTRGKAMCTHARHEPARVCCAAKRNRFRVYLHVRRSPSRKIGLGERRKWRTGSAFAAQETARERDPPRWAAWPSGAAFTLRLRAVVAGPPRRAKNVEKSERSA